MLQLVFFAFLAVCVIASVWKRKKLETIRHETARVLIEKNPSMDPAALVQLFNLPPPAMKPGSAYRMMNVVGSVVIAIGVGLWFMCLWFTFVSGDKSSIAIGGQATLVATIGAGILFAARFMPRPPAKDEETKPSGSSKNVVEP